MQNTTSFEKPRWLRDFLRFLPLKSQFVLTGNVRDLQAYEVAPQRITSLGLIETLTETLHDEGYGAILLWNPVHGLQILHALKASADGDTRILEQMGLTAETAPGIPVDALPALLERFVGLRGEPAAILLDFASRLVVRSDSLSTAENDLFTRALILSHHAKSRPHGTERKPFFNSVLWVAEKEGDLPDWLTIGNPRIRVIPVARPDARIRATLASAMLRSLPDYKESDSESIGKAADVFVDTTDGLLLADMRAIIQLAAMEKVPLGKIADAVRRYKVGVTEDPWQRIDKKKIQNAAAVVHARVKGQDHAVTHILDIIKRAITGVGSGRRGNRPRGAVFLAGPTGVGKTELAKTITSLLFGDESAYIRFDMSEFSAEHSDQRLLGAPPGYIGYDMGGELTNAVRENPFSVILFDEVEKAHPRILDKFLQILDDGVLTSGRGDRVYFSEALILFTSNLGIYRTGALGTRELNVMPSEPFADIQRKVTAEIQRHFKEVLNRPELLNRIGENIIIFDFIREDTAREIFDQMVAGIYADLRGQGYTIALEDSALETLRKLCLGDLSHGGRGIRNQLEAHLLNPLARLVFDKNMQPGQTWKILQIGREGLAAGMAVPE
jgi:energy-coupling factor transporter ATP-binding protein EcfA2